MPVAEFSYSTKRNIIPLARKLTPRHRRPQVGAAPQERAWGTEEAVPLSALRVIEIGSLPAAAYCARLLADFGAEVIKIEPPSGDPGRHAAPLLPDSTDSASFAFLNFGKQ